MSIDLTQLAIDEANAALQQLREKKVFGVQTKPILLESIARTLGAAVGVIHAHEFSRGVVNSLYSRYGRVFPDVVSSGLVQYIGERGAQHDVYATSIAILAEAAAREKHADLVFAKVDLTIPNNGPGHRGASNLLYRRIADAKTYLQPMLGPPTLTLTIDVNTLPRK